MTTVLNVVLVDNNEAAEIKTVRMTSNEWCPYICADTLRNKGLIIEVVSLAFKEVGLKTEYTYTKSWKRSIQETIAGNQDILLDADDEHLELLDFATNFYINDESVLVHLKNRKITLNYPIDLLQYKLGVIEDYIYDEKDGLWIKYIGEHSNTLKIKESLGEPHLLELLTRKRIDLAVVNWQVAKYQLDEEQLKKFEYITKDIITLIHIGFTRSERGERIKAKFEQGFNRLIGTDKLKNIYAKYHVEMPDFTHPDE